MKDWLGSATFFAVTPEQEDTYQTKGQAGATSVAHHRQAPIECLKDGKLQTSLLWNIQ